MIKLYPLRLREILRDYGFGGGWISRAFPAKGLPADQAISETWEATCRCGDISVVSEGDLAGATLQELIGECGERLLGPAMVSEFGSHFPLLIKFLDVTGRLNEQAHPNDEMAARFAYPDPGKTEAWYMVAVKPGASIRIGGRKGVRRADIGRAMIAGTAPELIKEQPLKQGDSFLLYGGTLHYSAGGMLLYEIMQNSNAHIALLKLPEKIAPGRRDALIRRAETCINIEPGADHRTGQIALAEKSGARTFIFACRHFVLERLDLSGPRRLSERDDRFCVLTQLEGSVQVHSGSRSVQLRPGNSCLVPAAGQSRVELLPEGGRAALLKAYVPDLARDVIKPLRAAGADEARIALLGGRTKLNHLAALLKAPARRRRRRS